MDFISKLLQRKPSKQGGCGNSNSIASTPVTGSEHKAHISGVTSECETPVHFTREFVEELVDNVSKESDKTTSSTSCHKVEDKHHLSCVGQESLPGSLPDLLLPEAAFKKQSDTDTDTTEYESAAETDPQDGLSRSGSLTADDVVLPDETVREDVSTSLPQVDEAVKDDKLSTGDISILCDGLNKLNLDTPEKEDTTFTLVENHEEQLKTFCAPKHLLKGIVASENLVDVSSENILIQRSLEASVDINEFIEHSVPVKEHPEVRNHEQVLNEKYNVFVKGTDFLIGPGKIPEQFDNSVKTSSDYIKSDLISAVFKSTNDNTAHCEQSNEALKSTSDISIQNEQTNDFFKLSSDIPIQSEQNSNVFIPTSDIPIQGEQISDVLTSTGDIPIQSKQISDVLLPNSDIALQSEHVDVDIKTCIEETTTLAFEQAEDNGTKQYNSCTVKSDFKLPHISKGDFELIEEPNNINAPSVSKTESDLCVSEYNSTTLQLNKGLVTNDSNTLKTDGTKGSCLRESSSDILIKDKSVVDCTSILCQKDTKFLQESSCADTKEHNKVGCSVTEAGDSQDAESTEEASRHSDYSVKICSTSLQGGGDSKQTDKDYKLYESIIEISRLQEKDLEKEYGVGSTVKADSTENEEAAISNAVCCTPVLNDFVSETQEFGNISSEAEKVAEEIFNVSQEIAEELNDLTITDLKCTIDDHMVLSMEDKIDPFIPKSALRHSPPPAPRSNSPLSPRSRGSSPAKKYSSERSSPKIRPKSMMGTPGKEKNFHDSDPIDSMPRAAEPTLIAVKSNDTLVNPAHQKYSVESTEDSLRAISLSNEANHSDSIPVISKESGCAVQEVFREFSGDDFLLSDSVRQKEEELRRESLVAKFDPLSNTMSKTDDSLTSVSPKAVKNTSERRDGRPVTPDYRNNSSELPIPNQALAYIDKLISLSPTSSKPEKSTEVLKDRNNSEIRDSKLSNFEKECLRDFNNSQNNIPWNSDTDSEEREAMLNELQELRDMVIKQEQSSTEKIKCLENKIESLEIKLKEKEEKECKLNKKITEMTEGQEQISLIMEEYERTIARLVFEKEQEKQEFEELKANLIKEKDTVSEHLANIEIAFSDVHRKYERSKDVIQGIKSNEEALRASLAEYEATIKQQEQKYDLLKSYATSQLESVSQELESVRRSHQAESAKLNAMLKKAEVKVSSLEEMVEQKIKENQELTSICDELIGKVGSSE